jgi:hypothetical protein
MKTVWKYQVPIGHQVTLEIPFGGIVVHTESQDDVICLWVEVESSNPKAHRSFKVFGTGHEIQMPYAIHVGTVQQGPFVWHVYEAE